MVLDYTHPSQGIEAQKVLFAVGINAILTPYKMLDRGGDMATTLFVVHRVEVPPPTPSAPPRCWTNTAYSSAPPNRGTDGARDGCASREALLTVGKVTGVALLVGAAVGVLAVLVVLALSNSNFPNFT